MDVLITGSTGFMGKALSRKLHERGYSITCTGKEATFDVPGVNYVSCDISNGRTLSGLLSGVDSVFHLAGTSNLAASFKSPVREIKINALGTATLLDACRKKGVNHVIFASSSSVYGMPTKNPVAESSPSKPMSPYAASKLMGEQLCKLYSDLYGMKCTILRFFNIYGAGDLPKPFGRLIPSIAYNLSMGGIINVTGTGAQERDFVNIEDVTNINVNVLEKGIGGTYNLGTGIGTSVNHIIEKLGELTDIRPKIKHTNSDNSEFNIVADISRLKSRIDFIPAIGIDDGLAGYVSWLKEEKIL